MGYAIVIIDGGLHGDPTAAARRAYIAFVVGGQAIPCQNVIAVAASRTQFIELTAHLAW